MMKKFAKTFLILTSLGFLASCVQNGHAPGTSDNGAYDGVACNTKITQNLSGPDFIARLQDGTEDAPFYVCIGPGVNINPENSYVRITQDYVFIQGYSNTTSILTGMYATSPHITFRRLKIASPAGQHALPFIPSDNGTASVINSNISYGRYGISTGGGHDITLTVTKSTFTPIVDSASIGISMVGSGTLTATVTDSVITSGTGSSFYVDTGNTVSLTIGGLVLKSNSSTSSSSIAFDLTKASGGSVTYTGTTKSLVCNVAGSAATFSDVFTFPNGTAFPMSDFTNASSTSIGDCP